MSHDAMPLFQLGEQPTVTSQEQVTYIEPVLLSKWDIVDGRYWVNGDPLWMYVGRLMARLAKDDSLYEQTLSEMLHIALYGDWLARLKALSVFACWKREGELRSEAILIQAETDETEAHYAQMNSMIVRPSSECVVIIRQHIHAWLTEHLRYQKSAPTKDIWFKEQYAEKTKKRDELGDQYDPFLDF